MNMLLTAGVAGLVASGAAHAAEPALLTIVSEAEVTRAPDMVEIGGGVVTTAPTAAEALAANARAMTAAMAALRRAGLAERDIQTRGLSLQPQYRYDNNRAPTLIGYQASNTVNVRLREVERAGPVIDALVAAGANQISGPVFRLAEPEAALDEARAAAVTRARARAALYARAAGVRLGRIVSISEAEAPQPPMPRPMMRAAMAEASMADTPVAPGELALTARVTVQFALEPLN